MIGRLPNDMAAKKEMNDHFSLPAILFFAWFNTDKRNNGHEHKSQLSRRGEIFKIQNGATGKFNV
jgi:hypothetical protein